MSNVKEINAINKAFAGLKGEKFTSEDVNREVENYISTYHPFQITHLEERKQAKVNGKFVKSRWAIVYDWNDSLGEDTFLSKNEAMQALDAYTSIMANDATIRCRNTLLMDRILVICIQKLKEEYSSKVANVQKRQGAFLAHEAKKSVKSMLKGFMR